MSNLNSRAKELLTTKTVQMIIGYETGPTGLIRPAFITESDKADRLIYNKNCRHNLAVYLTKAEVKNSGKIAIVATLPVMRSLMVLASENQISAENVIVIGISPGGDVLDIPDFNVMQSYIGKSDPGNPDRDNEKLAELLKLSPSERFEWWQNELSKCIKCFACRQACPMCYCNRCTVEVNQPQWIPVQANTQGNMDWHIMRAMHLAGRCISCGECGRVCPVGIPCHLLTMHLSNQVSDHFRVRAGTSDKMPSVLSTYDPNDKESFIR